MCSDCTLRGLDLSPVPTDALQLPSTFQNLSCPRRGRVEAEAGWKSGAGWKQALPRVAESDGKFPTVWILCLYFRWLLLLFFPHAVARSPDPINTDRDVNMAVPRPTL